MKLFENLLLKAGQIRSIDGDLCIDHDVLDRFLAAPLDPLPEFEGAPNYQLKNNGRGKDHPRYGRFVYALARHYRPSYIVEVGTFAGGTAVGFAKAINENGRGKLICVDQDSYSNGTFPQVVKRNLARVGFSESKLQLCCGDSKEWLPTLAKTLKGKVDIVLVDGDHTYDGALADLKNAVPLVKPGGFILVHDVDRNRRMDEATAEHPHPVYEAFHRLVADQQLNWCILKFIRKHLGIIQVPGAKASVSKEFAA
ncbi:MAG TPA: class I SAM-dependent methyltransferase [Pirellulaceae bacterium]|nr:class I SAM-dependent methyltransferase [Pirellulaceae bacterium]